MSPSASPAKKVKRSPAFFEVEALLFSSGRALSEDALASILDTDPKHIRSALKQLREEYDARDTALKIFADEKQWKMLVRDQYIEVVRRVVADTELSRPTLETLAVIAYNNPALQAKVVDTRGSGAYEHIKELAAAGFVTKVAEGRSYRLKLSEKFFEYFDVEGSDDIRELFKDIQEPEAPHDIDGLEVVDVPEAKEKELVDVPHGVNPFEERELGIKPELSQEEKAAHEDFLADLDKKIESVSSRNDAHEQDENLRLQDDESSEEDDDSEKKKSALDEPLDLEKI